MYICSTHASFLGYDVVGIWLCHPVLLLPLGETKPKKTKAKKKKAQDVPVSDNNAANIFDDPLNV